VSDLETGRHGAAMQVAILTAAKMSEPAEMAIQGSAEAHAGAVDRIPLPRVGLSPPLRDGALLDHAHSARPQVRSGRTGLELDVEPVVRHP
jgi:hypothetical protein